MKKEQATREAEEYARGRLPGFVNGVGINSDASFGVRILFVDTMTSAGVGPVEIHMPGDRSRLQRGTAMAAEYKEAVATDCLVAHEQWLKEVAGRACDDPAGVLGEAGIAIEAPAVGVEDFQRYEPVHFCYIYGVSSTGGKGWFRPLVVEFTDPTG